MFVKGKKNNEHIYKTREKQLRCPPKHIFCDTIYKMYSIKQVAEYNYIQQCLKTTTDFVQNAVPLTRSMLSG